MTRSILACALFTAAIVAIPGAACAKAGAHRTRLMPYVEVPVDHGLWLTPDTPCNRVANVDSPLMWFPAPPRENKFLACAPGMRQTGPATYQDIGCPGDGSTASTYKVISRTRMLVDGALVRLCPVSQLPEPFRTTVLEQLAQDRAGR